MDLLPDELIQLQALQLDLRSLMNLCRASRRFHELICQNNNFWRQKFIHDHGFELPHTGCWQELYLSFDSVWISRRATSPLTRDGVFSAPTKILGLQAEDVSVGGGRIFTIDRAGRGWIVDEPGETLLSSLRLKQISIGVEYTLLIDIHDQVWAFGSGRYGELGLGDNLDRMTPTFISSVSAKQVSAGYSHSLLIDLQDQVWSFGQNHQGQLGLGDTQGRCRPTLLPGFKAKQISIKGYRSFLIDLEDRLWTWGEHRYVPEMIPHPRVKRISAGGHHVLLIDLQDQLWSFGSNREGQLGLGDTVDRSTPTMVPGLKVKEISAGVDHSAVIDLQGQVWVFGSNITQYREFGKLGLETDVEYISVPTRLPNFRAKKIGAGYTRTILLGIKIP